MDDCHLTELNFDLIQPEGATCARLEPCEERYSGSTAVPGQQAGSWVGSRETGSRALPKRERERALHHTQLRAISLYAHTCLGSKAENASLFTVEIVKTRPYLIVRYFVDSLFSAAARATPSVALEDSATAELHDGPVFGNDQADLEI